MTLTMSLQVKVEGHLFPFKGYKEKQLRQALLEEKAASQYYFKVKKTPQGQIKVK